MNVLVPWHYGHSARSSVSLFWPAILRFLNNCWASAGRPRCRPCCWRLYRRNYWLQVHICYPRCSHWGLACVWRPIPPRNVCPCCAPPRYARARPRERLAGESNERTNRRLAVALGQPQSPICDADKKLHLLHIQLVYGHVRFRF